MRCSDGGWDDEGWRTRIRHRLDRENACRLRVLLTVETRGIELGLDESDLDRLSCGLCFDDSSEGECAGGEVGQHGGGVCRVLESVVYAMCVVVGGKQASVARNALQIHQQNRGQTRNRAACMMESGTRDKVEWEHRME
jgi:hypothetical protein